MHIIYWIPDGLDRELKLIKSVKLQFLTSSLKIDSREKHVSEISKFKAFISNYYLPKKKLHKECSSSCKRNHQKPKHLQDN